MEWRWSSRWPIPHRPWDTRSGLQCNILLVFYRTVSVRQSEGEGETYWLGASEFWISSSSLATRGQYTVLLSLWQTIRYDTVWISQGVTDMVSKSAYKNRNADEKWTIWFEPLDGWCQSRRECGNVRPLLNARYNLENHFSNGIVTLRIHWPPFSNQSEGPKLSPGPTI